MNKVSPLAADQLFRRCDPESLSFETTAELPDIEETTGQERALEALRFGVGMRPRGYNIFVLGPPAADKRTVVHHFLEHEANPRHQRSDWVYAHNFADPQRPRAMKLPVGRGPELRRDMEELLADLRVTIPAAFESQEYRDRAAEIEQDLQSRQNQSLVELRKEAERHGMGLLPTPQGFAIAPVRDGEVLSNEEFEKLPEEERERLQTLVAELMGQLRQRLEQFPIWAREARKKGKELDREVTISTVGPLLDELEKRYSELPEVLEYLDEVKSDLVENVHDFRRSEEGPENLMGLVRAGQTPSLTRYKINLLVDNSEGDGPPIVYESHPTHGNLVGRIEHVSTFGALTTDFTLIKPGALHRANGGYLILDSDRLLTQPWAWQGLKQALFADEIRIQGLDRIFNLVSTVSLEPEPIPLDVKVVLLGSRLFYHLLSAYDDDFADLFKVAADFEDEVPRSKESEALYARLLATLAKREELLPFGRAAVARVIEQLGRQVSDSERLNTHIRSISDLLRDSDYWARLRDDSATVEAQDVQKAIDHRRRRLDRFQRNLQEEIRRQVLLIDTAGETVGQVNGLAVFSLGEIAFGHPTRITATARLGKGEVVDIEREVELGGSIHSKGVLILSSFLGHRYAPDVPLSLQASLVFEQSYGGVEGDSATIAETCALLSALAGVPIRQELAVTGSMNQHGRVQAVGGVNEKIEGFFEICEKRGLTGDQGVLLPADNVKHLMLDRAVVEAVADGRFSIYPIATVDEALSLLTGIEAGEREASGDFPEGTVNRRVEDRLVHFAELAKEYRGKEEGEETPLGEPPPGDGA